MGLAVAVGAKGADVFKSVEATISEVLDVMDLKIGGVVTSAIEWSARAAPFADAKGTA